MILQCLLACRHGPGPQCGFFNEPCSSVVSGGHCRIVYYDGNWDDLTKSQKLSRKTLAEKTLTEDQLNRAAESRFNKGVL